MGQYYKPVCIDSREYMYTHDYDSGLKLMEHSWILNDFVWAVEGLLTPKGRWCGQRIVWAGDYMDEKLFIDMNSSESQRIIDHIWKENLEQKEEHRRYKSREEVGFTLYHFASEAYRKIKPAFVNMLEARFFFINNINKEVFVDKRECPEDDGWIIHPLPLLTCSGNGRGGGDYRGDNPHVGTWAGDRIIITKEPMKEYKEFKPDFVE